MVPDPNENPVTQPADDFIEAEGRRAALEGATAPEPPVGEPDPSPSAGREARGGLHGEERLPGRAQHHRQFAR
jgi:SRSO17 transposase